MIGHESPVRTESRHVRPKLGRLGRLSRRVVLPLTLLALSAALAVTGYARLAGAPASPERPFAWDGSSVHITAGHTPGSPTTCVITPDRGQRRVVEVPNSSDGLVLEPWFKGNAELACGRSVMVMTGWQSGLYPYVSGRPLLLGLAALAVLAWWFGRMPRGRLSVHNAYCGGTVDPRPVWHQLASLPWPSLVDSTMVPGPVIGREPGPGRTAPTHPSARTRRPPHPCGCGGRIRKEE